MSGPKGITSDDVLEATDAASPPTTKEIAEELGIERQSADYRLRKLEDGGEVSSQLVGNTLIWSREDNAD